jgi:hypothetical protein
MRRLCGALAPLALIAALLVGLPATAPASPFAGASAKHRCKKHGKKHHKRRKRCGKKRAGSTGPTAGKPGGGGGPTAPSGPPGRLLATELEISATQLQLQLSRASVASGPTIVQQYNAGSDPHNLILERSGSVAFAYPTLDPGLNQRQTIDLAKGTWTLYCSLLDHRELGMQATLKVD